jgi:hypothetical protein
MMMKFSQGNHFLEKMFDPKTGVKGVFWGKICPKSNVPQNA